MATYNQTTAITNGIRQAYRGDPVKKQCLVNSIHPTIKGPRGGAYCVCNECREAFPMKEVQVDHIMPVIPINQTIHELGWNEYISRLFCLLINLQVLCKPCHKKKCALENDARFDYKSSSKL